MSGVVRSKYKYQNDLTKDDRNILRFARKSPLCLPIQLPSVLQLRQRLIHWYVA